MKKIKLRFVPKADVRNGLVCVFDSKTETETEYSFADLKKGQKVYEYPPDPRKVKAIYVRV